VHNHEERTPSHRLDRIGRARVGRVALLCAGCHVCGEDVVGVAVEVLPSPVVSHGGAGVGVASGDLYVAQVDSCVQHCGHERMAQHVRVHSRESDAGRTGKAP
jgi:hypothetical protein